MFEQMVIAKDGDAIARYYHPDFVMYSDGMTQGFAEFEASHRGIYETPGEKPTRIEVVLIATFVDGLIHRVWETTWPSWRTVEGFEDY
jgi:hypothetical protein